MATKSRDQQIQDKLNLMQQLAAQLEAFGIDMQPVTDHIRVVNVNFVMSRLESSTPPDKGMTNE